MSDRCRASTQPTKKKTQGKEVLHALPQPLGDTWSPPWWGLCGECSQLLAALPAAQSAECSPESALEWTRAHVHKRATTSSSRKGNSSDHRQFHHSYLLWRVDRGSKMKLRSCSDRRLSWVTGLSESDRQCFVPNHRMHCRCNTCI